MKHGDVKSTTYIDSTINHKIFESNFTFHVI